MRILVCGGRQFGTMPDDVVFGTPAWYREIKRVTAEADLLRRTLSSLPEVRFVIHGEAKGADSHAALWASVNGVTVEAYPADWKKHGRAAGPLRNARMLAEGKPDLVIAFPGGRGTADMVRKAEAAGVPVRKIPSALPCDAGEE